MGAEIFTASADRQRDNDDRLDRGGSERYHNDADARAREAMLTDTTCDVVERCGRDACANATVPSE